MQNGDHPREFDYAAFVDELKPLVAEAESFDIADKAHDSAVFRAWRHRVEALIIRISRTHMDVDCDLNQRAFRVMAYGSVGRGDSLRAFERDLRDTLIELHHIIDWHAKYGEPKMRPGAIKTAKRVAEAVPATPPKPAAMPAPEDPPKPAKPTEPEWPSKEKLTLHWLFKHMPASAWGWLVLFVAGAFGAGVTVGNWPSVQKRFETWANEPAKAAAPAASTPTAPSAKAASR